MAAINGKLVQEGQMIEGFTLKTIRGDNAILEKDGVLVTLKVSAKFADSTHSAPPTLSASDLEDAQRQLKALRQQQAAASVVIPAPAPIMPPLLAGGTIGFGSLPHHGYKFCDVLCNDTGAGASGVSCYFWTNSIDIEFSNGGKIEVWHPKVRVDGLNRVYYEGTDDSGRTWKIRP
jgi:hypothetical protein